VGVSGNSSPLTRDICRGGFEIDAGCSEDRRVRTIAGWRCGRADAVSLERILREGSDHVDELVGRVAFVTGSAGGIGLGIARACADAGMKVVVSDIDEATLELAAAELRGTGAEVMAFPLDTTDREGWARAVREVPSAMGPVQLLVNNAGVSTLGTRVEDIDPEMWDRVIAINLTGVYNGVHHFLGGMREAGGGHIVNTSSMAGLLPVPMLLPYCSTKAALVGFSEALRYELKPSGIGVSVLCPGQVRSRLWRTSRVVRGLPDIDVPPTDGTAGSADADMGPDEVGRRVLEAVLADDLYVMTHADGREMLTKRHERLLRAFDRAEAFAL
jgi:NAD(P)-dependent dehydrogenase (short-subunit alcohol dehydrogenase family)